MFDLSHYFTYCSFKTINNRQIFFLYKSSLLIRVEVSQGLVDVVLADCSPPTHARFLMWPQAE